jgi:CxxC motif-containing protein (DUF1111 family)
MRLRTQATGTPGESLERAGRRIGERHQRRVRALAASARLAWVLAGCSIAMTVLADAPADPGVRSGPSAAGGPLDGLTDAQTSAFFSGWQNFKQLYSVSGTLERGAGLGPTFNALGCASCHAQPAAGGTSSSPNSPQVRRLVLRDQRITLDMQPNPQASLGRLHRAPDGEQPVPPFVTPDGPVRVARFIHKPDGTFDGEVHPLFTIAGRIDAPGCELQPADFSAEMAKNNVMFRVPTPLFGAGLIEAVSDSTLEENLRSSAQRRQELGVAGHFNRVKDAKVIGRFGWKAQNASLFMFVAEAHNLEIGATNEVFPNKRGATDECEAGSFQKVTNYEEGATANDFGVTYKEGGHGSLSSLGQMATFLRLSAAPKPATHSESELLGQRLFSAIGCELCHSESLHTGRSTVHSIERVVIHPYSDFALHPMGPALSDHIPQGLAAGDEYRTAPLWGLGQRLFFLHDGRTGDLLAAINAHSSARPDCQESGKGQAESCASEANRVIHNFAALPPEQQQDLLNFLRSL